jgi:hypothetical protein
MSWAVPAVPDDNALRAWVIAQVARALEEAGHAAHREAGPPAQGARAVEDAAAVASGYAQPRHVLIGKSLGSLAAPVAADLGLPAVWLTPLLKDEPTVRAMRSAQCPCLLVGGTADEAWDGAVARSITPHVMEVCGADHGMFVPGPLAASAEVLGKVATAVEIFLDEVAWVLD